MYYNTRIHLYIYIMYSRSDVVIISLINYNDRELFSDMAWHIGITDNGDEQLTCKNKNNNNNVNDK